jgi:hypothetical protein
MEHSSKERHEIFLLAKGCNDAFDEAIEEATEKQADVTRLSLQHLYEEFEFWAAYMGTYAPGSASLDSRLRLHASHRSLIRMSLFMLRENLDYCTFRKRHLSGSPVLISSTVCSYHGNDSDSTNSDGEAENPVDVALEGIKDALEQLNQFALSLRQSRVSTSAGRVAKFQEKIRYTPGFRNFANLTLRILTSLYPDTPDSLARQLHGSVLFRYARLEYCRSHEGKLKSIRPPDDAISSDLGTTENSRHVSTGPDSTPVEPSKARKQTEKINRHNTESSTLSETNATTFCTGLRPASSPSHPRRKAASSTIMGEVDLPLPPTSYDTSDNPKCSFCRILHPRRYYDEKGWWRYVLITFTAL